jgi:hypothetical protein
MADLTRNMNELPSVLAISYIVITFLSGHTIPLKSEVPDL